MNIAQGFYEGVDLGKEGAEGLITYMRTDSVRIAPEASTARYALSFETNYGKNICPLKRELPRRRSPKMRTKPFAPQTFNIRQILIKEYLNREQSMLYKLIWQRFVASQMNPAMYDTVSADIDAGSRIVLRATGSAIKFRVS